MKFFKSALLASITSAIQVQARVGGMEPDGSSFICFIESFQQSDCSLIQGILQLGPGTWSKNGISLWEDGWTLGPDGRLTINDHDDPTVPTWCHDKGIVKEMRYEVQFVFGSIDETLVVVSSESTLPAGKTVWTQDIQAMTADGATALPYLRVQCNWKPVSCHQMGFIYDYRGLDDLEARKEEIDEVYLEGNQAEVEYLQKELEDDLDRGVFDDLTKANRSLIEREDDVFYEDVPELTGHQIDQVMEWVAAEVAQMRLPFCWRDSYGRGVGKIPAKCPSEKDKIGGFCYSKCPLGMKRFGFDCHSVCPFDFRDDGLFLSQGRVRAQHWFSLEIQ